MSRERNLLHLVEDFKEGEFCPSCKSLHIKRASSDKSNNYTIDIFSDRWLECRECGTTWRRPDKIEKEDNEDRKRV